jgi:hypothetical protein
LERTVCGASPETMVRQWPLSPELNGPEFMPKKASNGDAG